MARKNTGLTKDEFVSEAQRLVTDLAFLCRRPVKIKLVGGDHIAFTYNTEDTKHVIEVVDQTASRMYAPKSVPP